MFENSDLLNTIQFVFHGFHNFTLNFALTQLEIQRTTRKDH